MANSIRTRLGDIISKANIVKCGNDNYPVLSMTMHDGIMLQSERFKKSLASTDTSEYKVVKTGQLVVGFPIDEGVLYIQHYDFDGIMSPAYDIWNVDYSKINDYYLEYALHSPQSMQYYASKLRGTTARRRSIPKEDLLNLSFPLPPLETQKQIAANLDKVTHTIDLCNNILEKLDLLVKARFVEMFGDHQEEQKGIPIGELCDMVTVGIANAATHAYAESGVLMFRNLNIRENLLDDTDLIYIKPEFAAKYISKALKYNDILVTRTGYPGQACLVPEKYEGAQTFTTLIVRLKENKNLLPSFVCHYINSPFGKRFVKRHQAGVAQQNFGATAMGKMPIVIPAIEMQKAFVSFAEQTYKSKSAVKQVLEKAETLKKALMQEYFG